MLSMLHRLALVTVAVMAASTAQAEGWSLEEYRDPQNAQVVQAAASENAEGYSVRIFRSGDKRVQWVMSLPRSSFDRLTTRDRIAAFRIDDLEAGELSIMPPNKYLSLPEETHVEGLWVKDILWHGEDPSPTRGSLRDLLDGETLTVRFFLDDGKSVDTTFPLDGAPPVIEQAIGITAQADPVAVARNEDRDKAILLGTTVCTSSSDAMACAGVLSDCMGDDANNLTGDVLRSCMAAAGYPFR